MIAAGFEEDDNDSHLNNLLPESCRGISGDELLAKIEQLRQELEGRSEQATNRSLNNVEADQERRANLEAFTNRVERIGQMLRKMREENDGGS